MTTTAAAAVRAAKGWTRCPACQWPIDPAALEGGHDRHPACEQRPQLTVVKGNKPWN